MDTIVFDLDGTLIDSAPDIHAALNVALAPVGRGPVDLARTIGFIGNGVEVLVQRALAFTGGADEAMQAATLARFRAYYDANTTTLTRPYPGVTDCLAALSAAGKVMGICTNKPTAPARAICAALGLERHFAVIRGAEPDMPRKPDPAPLLRTIADLGGRPERTLYVGDSIVDLHTARNAGVAFRLFSGGYLNAPGTDLPASAVFADWSDPGLAH